MMKPIPKHFEGYKSTDDDKGRELKIGTLTYSMAEKSFVKKKQKITLMLFDYINAPIMYYQATGKWNSQAGEENGTISQRAFSVNDNTGWEFYHKLTNTSQIALGINKRFYMVLNGTEVDLVVLHDLLAMISLSDFPTRSLDFTQAKNR